MAGGKRERASKTDDDTAENHKPFHGPRPFWSGTISFGLVSLPVSLFVATRSKRVALRMIDADGHPLARRYFCPKHAKALEPDEIVRGYEIDDDQFVLVDDDELDAVAPDKSKVMDLEQFVPFDDIDPMYFQRAYFLAPDQGAIKQYRLLAQGMEETGRAGIATCVIRGKEYLMAILSSHGILRAEIMRFADELRSPKDVGLEAPPKSKPATVDRLKKALAALQADTLDKQVLEDRYAQRIESMVDKKLDAGEDIIDEQSMASSERAEPPPSDNDPIDLMAVLKERLSNADASASDDNSAATDEDRTRDELYAEAQERGISGRSKMSKAELAAAIESD